MMVYGPSGCGKTFLVLDWLLHLATERAWQNLKTAQSDFVYLAGEGHHGLKKRIAGWLAYYGHDAAHINAAISRSGNDLDTPAGLSKTIESIRESGVRPSVIVVDTLHRFLSGNENESTAAREMIKNCQVLMSTFSASVLLVHHTGLSKDAQGRARGSSAWKGSLEIEISVSKSDEAMVLKCTKSKDSEQPKDIHLRMDRIDVPGWSDEYGNPENTAVLLTGEAPERKESAQEKAIKTGKESFRLAWSASGRDTHDGAPYVSRAAWRRLLMDNDGMGERSVKQALKGSDSRRPTYLSKMIQADLLREEADGFVAVNLWLDSS
jgi:archaellum biogenesis ATPase FlaH